MQFKPWIVATILCTAALGAVAQAQTVTPPSVKAVNMLTGAGGLTLYVFDPDPLGKSVCNGACADKWPPLFAGPGATPVGAFTIVVRDDGSKQWAYKGKPLYYFKNDTQALDTTGDGVGGRWHIAAP